MVTGIEKIEMIRQLDKIYRLDHAVSKNTKSCAECIWKNF